MYQIMGDIDYEAAEKVMAYLDSTQGRRATLWISGLGGEIAPALSMCDAIHVHGKVVGIASSNVESSHMDIFMSCQERYFAPNAVLGYHSTKHYINGYTDIRHLKNLIAEHDSYTDRVVKIYTNASSLSYDEWLNMIMATGARGIQSISGDDMIKLGIARPYNQRFA